MDKAEIGDTWYRYTDPATETSAPWLECFPVLRLTTAGVWLDHYGQEKFVLNPTWVWGRTWADMDNGGKRFAYPTERMARWSYLYRKRKQLSHLATQHDRIAAILARHKVGELFAPQEREKGPPMEDVKQIIARHGGQQEAWFSMAADAIERGEHGE